MLIPAGNLNPTTLHKEPPLIRGPTTAQKGSSLMAGGGAVYLNFGACQCKISSIQRKKMMWDNSASLIAGGGANYLNFDTGLMQNIVESLLLWAVQGPLQTCWGANTLQPLWEVGGWENLFKLNLIGWIPPILQGRWMPTKCWCSISVFLQLSNIQSVQ